MNCMLKIISTLLYQRYFRIENVETFQFNIYIWIQCIHISTNSVVMCQFAKLYYHVTYPNSKKYKIRYHVRYPNGKHKKKCVVRKKGVVSVMPCSWKMFATQVCHFLLLKAFSILIKKSHLYLKDREQREENSREPFLNYHLNFSKKKLLYVWESKQK